MDTNEKRPSFQLLVLITTIHLAEEATDFFRQEALPIQYRMHAQGTASSDILDMLGLGRVDKCVVFCMLPESLSKKMLRKLNVELKLYMPNSGIAFTIPMTGANNLLLRILSQSAEDNDSINERKGDIYMSDSKHVLIAAIVNRGFSGNVMDAAKGAGARGGTVMQSRRIRDAEAAGCWGLGPEDEKEIVLILANNEDKVNIMREISSHCGVHSEAKGAVMSLPVDSVVGLSIETE